MQTIARILPLMPQPNVPSVTIKTIAVAAGVSNPTVSRALRNDPRISLATRERVQAIAKELGYRPDPAMSALVAYRQRVQPTGNYGKLAILNAWGLPEEKLMFYFKQQLAGIRERATQLGYQTELFDVPVDVAGQKHLSRTLAARGIRGIVVGPVPLQRRELNLDWEGFSAVAVGYSLTSPALHYAANDHHLTMDTLYGQLKALGYRKIGFYNHINSERRNRHIYLATYLKCLLLDGVSYDAAPPLLAGAGVTTGVLNWLDKHQFDAVIAGYFESQALLRDLAEAGRIVPRDLGVAAIAVPMDDAVTSGVRENLVHMGVLAVDQLHAQLIHGERGIPQRRHSVLVESGWCQGTTVRSEALVGSGG